MRFYEDNSWISSRLHKEITSSGSSQSSTINKLAKECDGDDITTSQNAELQFVETVRKDQKFGVIENEKYASAVSQTLLAHFRASETVICSLYETETSSAFVKKSLTL